MPPPTSSVPSSIKIIMATHPLGYLLPALSGSLKYGEVMGPKWIVLACLLYIIIPGYYDFDRIYEI